MVGKLRLLAAVLCLGLIGAWPNTGKVHRGTAVVAAYSGPGDVVTSARAWWGLRAYTNALANAGATTTPVVDVRGSSTATSCTIYLKGDGTGNLDLTTSGAGGIGHQCASGATTFCTITNPSCTVSKFYDQTVGSHCAAASCDLTQGTVANQPTFTFNCIGSLPCLTVSGNQQLLNAGSLSLAQTFTVTVESERTTNPGGGQFIVGDNTGTFTSILYDTTPSTAVLFAGTVSADVTVSNNSFHSIQGIFAGAASIMVVDGSATTGLNAGASGIGPPAIFSGVSFTDPMTGSLAETGLWASGFNSTQYGNMSTNMTAYW